jgi:hypothetical protein
MQENILTDVADLIRMINKGIDGGDYEMNIREMIEMRVGSIVNVLLLGYRFDENRIEEFRIVKGKCLNNLKDILHLRPHCQAYCLRRRPPIPFDSIKCQVLQTHSGFQTFS